MIHEETYAYAFMNRSSYRPLDRESLTEHLERVQREVIPKLREQEEQKMLGIRRLIHGGSSA
jgi:hypothetical protein